VASAAAVQAYPPFKIGVVVDNKAWFLTRSINASERIEDGITCVIEDQNGLRDSLVCEGDLGLYFADTHPFEGALIPITKGVAEKREKSNKLFFNGYAVSNQNWSIEPDGKVRWRTTKPGPPPTYNNDVHISKKVGGKPNQFFAEVCSGLQHPDGKGFIPGQIGAWVKTSNSQGHRRYSTANDEESWMPPSFISQ
jgi:hypothetical protein